MSDTTIKKVEAGSSPKGEMGQRYLVAGKRVSMRIWIDEPGGKLKAPSSRQYETVGYVISGSAKIEIEGQTLNLKRGDSWLVPAGAMHQYTIIEPLGSPGRGSWPRYARIKKFRPPEVGCFARPCPPSAKGICA